MQTSIVRAIVLISFFWITGLSSPIYGQFADDPPSIANIAIPPSPEAAALAQYVETPVSWYTGSPSFNLPLWTLQSRDLSLPISLSYHGGGIKVDQIASRIGLGWAMNAGGVISRTVRGKPDEKPNGWLQIASQIPSPAFSGAHEVDNNGYNNTEQELLLDIAQGGKDGQPDAFHVNMPGWSGRIVFDASGNPIPIPYAKLKIEVDWINYGWDITTPDGIKYTFGQDARENSITLSDCGDSYAQGVITAWYLKTIKSPNGDQIDLEYQGLGLIQEQLPLTETAYAPYGSGSTSSECVGKASDICGGTKNTSMVRLSAVRSAKGSVEFVYDTQNRTDLSGDFALQEIEIRRKDASLVKEYVLTHSYWSGRLMLDAVTETSANFTTLPPTTFNYYKTHSLPATGSFSQDHWGFANGKPNTTGIPRTELPDCKVIGSADRSPDFNYSRAGSLKEVIRPGGSKTTFEYESHSYTANPNEQEEVPAFADADAYCFGGPCGSPACSTCVPSQTVQIIIYHNQCVDMTVNLSNSGSFCDAEAKIYRQGGQVIQSWSCANSGTQSASIYLTAGTYFIEAKAYLPNDNASIRIDYTNESPIQEHIGGGIRIARIIEHDGFDSANDLVREFDYNYSENPNQPSGQIVTRPGYSFWYNEERDQSSAQTTIWTNCGFLAVSATTRQGLGTTQGSHVGYAEVTEKIGVGGANGKIVRRFSTALEAPNSLNTFPLGPTTSLDHLRGRLLNKIVYDNSGTLISEELHHFTESSSNETIIDCYNIGFKKHSGQDPNSISLNTMVLRPYEEVSQWSYIDTVITRTYDDNGINYTETKAISEYANPVHIQLTESRTTDSEGREVIQRFTYPGDYAVGANDQYALALSLLKQDKFMHAATIEKTTWQKKPGNTEELLSGHLTMYKEFQAGIIMPEKLMILEVATPIANFNSSTVTGGSFAIDSRYIERERVEAYDDYGHIVQVQRKDGIQASYKWGHNATLPVAEILNGASAYASASTNPTGPILEGSAAYTGFESADASALNPDEDFWEFKSGNAFAAGARSGNTCRELVAGSTVYGPTRELRPDDQAQRFIFSGWVKTNSGYSGGKLVIHSKANGGSNAVYPSSSQYDSYQSVSIPATNGEWQYLEVLLDLGGVRNAAAIPSATLLRILAYPVNQDANQKLWVDDLRIQPEDARMVTHAFDPMVGMTDQMGPNDLLTSFEYDDFLRLRLVRDHNGHILKRISYEYFGQNGATHNNVTEESAQTEISTETLFDAATVTDKFTTVQYQDGYGRGIQTISVGMSPASRDMIKIQDYDPYGNEVKNWLPFSKSGNQGAFVTNVPADQAAFYQQTNAVAVSNFPFSEKVLDGSPLNRVRETSAPGQGWQLGNGHTAETSYLVNTPSHPIRLWTPSASNCTSSSIYPTGELTGTRVEDEEDGDYYVFKDKLGRVIYKKVKVYDTDGKTQGGLGFSWLETYWVYNDFGKVAYVIPPKAIAEMVAYSNFDVNALGSDLVYRYVYDQRQRLVEKKIPGKEWEYTVYDNLDQAILHQDGNLRSQNKWNFKKYDRLGRAIVTGIFNDNIRLTRVLMQNHVDGLLSGQTVENHELRTPHNFATQYGYTDQAYPRSSDASSYYEDMSIKYFDDYDFDQDGLADMPYLQDPDNEFDDDSFSRQRGNVTRTQIRVLNSTAISAPMDWVTSTSFYNARGKLVQTQAINHLGDTELLFVNPDFVGKVENQKRIHKYGDPGEIKIRQRYTYDHSGRLLNTYQQNDGDDEVLVSHKGYNQLGQLTENNLHSTNNGSSFIQSVDFRYHIRGWLQQINNCELSNSYASGQRLWNLDDVRVELRVDTNDMGYRFLSMDVEMDQHSDAAEGLEYTSRTGVYGDRLLSEAEEDHAFDEGEQLVGTVWTLQMNGAALYADELDNSIQSAVSELNAELQNEGIQEAELYATMTALLRLAIESQEAPAWSNDDDNDLFGMYFHYEDGLEKLKGDRLHTGNISGICWKSKSDNMKRAYGFRYDAISRLREGHFAAMTPGATKWTSEVDHYTVPKIRYDVNGNITEAKRNGFITGNSFGLIDNLQYAYSGNELTSALDNAPSNGPNDFQDNGSTGTNEFLYDDNGNLSSDGNKGLSAEYNHLNLPTKVDMGGGNELLYLYDASGTKLARRLKQGGTPISIQHYIGEFVYKGTQLEYFDNTEGRVVPVSGGSQSYRFEYFYRDHLGNARMRFSDLDEDGVAEVSEILQEWHYYPQGMVLEGLNTPLVATAHRFSFNGKEIEDEFGLNWQDFGARRYDAQLGKWAGVDPKAEEFLSSSPYGFAFGNPVNLFDPDGMAPSDPSGNDPPTTDNWNPVTTRRLQRLAFLAGVQQMVGGSRVGFNQVVGLSFEGVISRSFNIPKNGTPFPTNKREKKSAVIPDYVLATNSLNLAPENMGVFRSGLAYMGEFPNEQLDFWEAKTSSTITVNKNDKQIKAMIHHLGQTIVPGTSKTAEELGTGPAALFLIVPFESTISEDIVDYANEMGVTVFKMVPYENPEVQGQMMFSPPENLNPSFPQRVVDAVIGAYNYITGEGNNQLVGRPTQIIFSR
ncbi:MAG: DUF6443 domain-containing protein [Bacteroidota bacterium]